MSGMAFYDPYVVRRYELQDLNTTTYSTSGPPAVLTEDAPEWLAFVRELETHASSGARGQQIWHRELSATRQRTRVAGAKTSGHQLKAVALQRLLSIIREQRVAPGAIKGALHLIESLAFDGAPTPQVAFSAPASLEIEWLVGDRSLLASCYDDGGVFLWAVDSDGEELFEEEFASWSRVAGETYMQAVELLKAMGSEITRPVQGRHGA